MPLTKQQLLIPRVMCIGGKEGEPNDTSGDFITGDILTQTVKKFCKWKSEKLKYTVYLDPDFVERFPHLFKPLPWFEMRDKSDMPNYVNNIKNGRIYKAVWDCFKFKGKKEWSLILQQNGIPINPDGFEPADLSDYQEYQKQKGA